MKEVQAALEAVARALPHPITIAPPLVSNPAILVPPVAALATTAADPVIANLSDQTVSRTQLSSGELAREVKALGKRWSLVHGDLLLDIYSRQMVKLGAVIGGIAAIADEMEHHPKLEVAFPHLRMTLPTAMTVVDLVFAARVEAWLRDNGW
jgi:pterin-4a-carbinolamine dehydratase